MRPVTPDDDEFLYQLYAGTRAEELAPVPWSATQKETFLRMQHEAQQRDYRANYPDASFDILVYDDGDIGRYYVHRTAGEILLVNIILAPAYRNLGLGTALIQNLQQEAAETGKRLWLSVDVFNRAQRLYQRLGFTLVPALGGPAGLYLTMEWRAPAEAGG